MRKIYKLGQLEKLKGEYSEFVLGYIKDYIIRLNDSYGVERNIDADLGGYVLILETKDDVIETRESILKDIIPEYADNIECEGGELYCLSLFLLSSDYAVVVVATKELMDILIKA